MPVSSPASRGNASQYDASGISVIAIISRMTSGYDMIRRRRRRGSRPAARAADTISSITPPPRQASSSPRRIRSGGHAPASTVPSRFTNAGAVTTARQNSAISPDRRGRSLPRTVPSPGNRRSPGLSTTVPAGVPASGETASRVAGTASGRVESTKGSWVQVGVANHTSAKEPASSPKHHIRVPVSGQHP